MGLTQFAPTEANINRYGLSITLGGGETRLLDLTSAFSVFARGGIRKDFNSILEVKDYKGKTIYKMKEPSEKRVLSEGVSFLISHILSDNNARSAVFGPRSYLNIPGKTVAVKTGTTDSKRDNWTVGYTKGVTVGVWVGNNNNTPMNEKIASGVTGASPIWNRIMNELLKTFPDGIPALPSNVSALQVDSYLGGLPKDSSQTRSEYFINGTEPKEVSSFYKKLKISKSTGKIANDLEVKQGNYDEKDYIVITEDDPVSQDGVNRWQEGINAWAKDQADDKLKPPTETSNANSDDIVVQIKEPGDHARIDGDQVHLRTRVTSLDTVSKIEILVNGSAQKTYTEDKRETDDTLTLTTGLYEIKVRAENSKGKSSEATIKIGVNKNWDEV
jgi:membrane carboxypeptidase/penicillin-binding protein PbpC